MGSAVGRSTLGGRTAHILRSPNAAVAAAEAEIEIACVVKLGQLLSFLTTAIGAFRKVTKSHLSLF